MIFSVEKFRRTRTNLWQTIRFNYGCMRSLKVVRTELKYHTRVENLRIPVLNRVIDISIKPPDGLWNLNPTVSGNSNVYFRQTTGAFFPQAGLDGNPLLENVSQEFKNAIFRGRISSNLEIDSVFEVLPLTGVPCLEDVRVVSERERDYLVGTLVTSSRPNPWKSSVAIYDIGKRRTIVLKSPLNNSIEKNWVPIEVSNGWLKILYSSNQLQIIDVDLDTGHQSNSVPISQSKTVLNGGSQFLKLHDGRYLRVARKRFAVIYRGRVHLSYLVLHDENFIELKRSRPFIFQTVGFEICNGLIQTSEGEIIFSWGENDRKMFLATASLENLLRWIEPLTTKNSHYSLMKIFTLLR